MSEAVKQLLIQPTLTTTFLIRIALEIYSTIPLELHLQSKKRTTAIECMQETIQRIVYRRKTERSNNKTFRWNKTTSNLITASTGGKIRKRSLLQLVEKPLQTIK